MQIDDPQILQQLTTKLLDAINSTSRSLLAKFLTTASPSSVLQILLSFTYGNESCRYHHEAEVVKAATELLGASCTTLNCIQIACFLGDEELACDIVDYVATEAQAMDARKVLYEFLGRVWGDGNTTLHLASFMGMSELVRRMLELGANPNKRNGRGYRAVDCADDELTRARFQRIAHVVRVPLRRSLSVDAVQTTRKVDKDVRTIATPVLNVDKGERGRLRVVSKETGKASSSLPWSTSTSSSISKLIEKFSASSAPPIPLPRKVRPVSQPIKTPSAIRKKVRFQQDAVLCDVAKLGDLASVQSILDTTNKAAIINTCLPKSSSLCSSRRSPGRL
jgi:hypothetical protein